MEKLDSISKTDKSIFDKIHFIKKILILNPNIFKTLFVTNSHIKLNYVNCTVELLYIHMSRHNFVNNRYLWFL